MSTVVLVAIKFHHIGKLPLLMNYWKLIYSEKTYFTDLS